MSFQSQRTGAADGGSPCWCGDGRLTDVVVGGVSYLYCDCCGGELGGR